MHTILLCGGSGQRLWPLSNRVRSKMFLELLPSPEGGQESMIGRVCRQLDRCGLGESALFVTHQDQMALTRRFTNNRYPVIGASASRINAEPLPQRRWESSIYIPQARQNWRIPSVWPRQTCS